MYVLVELILGWEGGNALHINRYITVVNLPSVCQWPWH